MNIFNSLRISASGLSAERVRLDTISANIANADATRTPTGGPYRRQVALLASSESDRNSFSSVLRKARSAKPQVNGVRVVGIVEDPTPSKMVYEPNHPDANEEGYVEYPNVNIMKEMVEAITASRAYEANVTAMNSTKSMFIKALEIGKG